MRKRKHSHSFQRLCKRRGWSCCPSDNAGKKTFFFLGTLPYVWCILMKYGQNKNAMKSFSISPDLRNEQKSPKSRVAESGFTQFLHRCGIYWMVHGESSCPGGSEYVCERGVEGVLGQVLTDGIWSASSDFGRPKHGPNYTTATSNPSFDLLWPIPISLFVSE